MKVVKIPSLAELDDSRRGRLGDGRGGEGGGGGNERENVDYFSTQTHSTLRVMALSEHNRISITFT